MEKREIYNYENPMFYSLRDPMREVMRSFLVAAQYYAAIKERVWGRFGMLYLSQAIHSLEHKQGGRIDQFSGAIRQEGLEVEYPGVPELTNTLEDLDVVFQLCIERTDKIDEALQRFIDVADRRVNEEGEAPSPEQGKFPALARQAEQLQIDNSMDKTKLLEAWSMWGNKPSMSSFDKWVKSRYDLGDDGEADD